MAPPAEVTAGEQLTGACPAGEAVYVGPGRGPVFTAEAAASSAEAALLARAADAVPPIQGLIPDTGLCRDELSYQSYSMER